MASSHLAHWVDRWCNSSRRVCLVGFSLGADVVWNAVRQVDKRHWPMIDIVLICGATPGTMMGGRWSGCDTFSSVVNVWSSRDAALNFLYPTVVPFSEVPAAGVGPVLAPGIRNVDLTDLIGMDHTWASKNIPRILRVVLGSSLSPPLPEVVSTSGMDAAAVERLCGWSFAVPDLWWKLGQVLDGRMDSREIQAFDPWSLEGDRLMSLFSAASTSISLSGRPSSSSDRSRLQIDGIIRQWMSQSLKRSLNGDLLGLDSGSTSGTGGGASGGSSSFSRSGTG